MNEADAKDLLNKENELIGMLIDTAKTFTQNLSGAQADVLNDWPEFFMNWRETNQKTSNSANFHQDLSTKTTKTVRLEIRVSVVRSRPWAPSPNCSNSQSRT